MYVYVVLSAVVLTASADKKEDVEKCKTLMNLHCCQEPFYNKTLATEEIIKECMLIPSAPGSCDRDVCFGTKEGFASEDGAIKRDKLEKHFEEKLSNYKHILQAVKKECFDGDHSPYGDSDDCELTKTLNCIRWQLTFRCSVFRDEESCKEVKNTSAKCLELRSKNF